MIRSPFKTLLAALAATWIYFFDYLPPVRWVHVPYDIEAYHFPLADYAFQSLKAGRWPLWDPSIYSGMPFTANPQVALFYPGTWLVFLAKWSQDRLSYQALLDLTLAHVALAFTLCFWWLRGKKFEPMAAILGAAVFAYSGYAMTQLQHFGLMVTFAWIPLGLIGIDEAAERGSWKPLWKTAVASALAFLGGYPPVWIAFVVAAGGYALFSRGTWKTALWASAALLFGLVICGIQLLPSWDASKLREHVPSYGLGIKDPKFYASYLIANLYDFGLDKPVKSNLGMDYLYLGVPGLLGIAMAMWPRVWKTSWRTLLQAIALGALSLIFVINPYNIVWNSIEWSPLLSDVIRSYYHLAGVAPAFALFAAVGLQAFLKRGGGNPRWLAPAAAAAMLSSICYELLLWSSSDPKGTRFVAGWASVWNLIPVLLVFTIGLFAYRASSGRARLWIGALLVFTIAVDYKVFGTGKRFNAVPGQGFVYSSDNFGAMERDAYTAMKPPRGAPMSDYRIMMMYFGPVPTDGRHVGWMAPQGQDPFFSIPYRKLIERRGKWENDRTLTLNPIEPAVMRVFGAKFVITAERASDFKELMASPRFKMVGANTSYYKVFEYLDALPIYQFPAGTLQVEKRVPEHRALKVDSPEGGMLTFSENWAPGWSAKIDGQPAKIEMWEDAFQSLNVPAGAHTVEFNYSEPLLPTGALVSAVALTMLGFWIRSSSKSTYSKANPAVSG